MVKTLVPIQGAVQNATNLLCVLGPSPVRDAPAAVWQQFVVRSNRSGQTC